MQNSTTLHTWVIEERVRLAQAFGKLLAKSLPKPGIYEEKIPYGPHPQQYLLLCRPEVPSERRRSAVYFLHGGGWREGSPAFYRFVGHFFAGLGFTTLLGGYRLAPEYHFPTQIEDARLGLEAGLVALDSLGTPAEGLIVGGISAGAHLASLLVYDHDRTGPRAYLRSLFRGIFMISGPLNFAVCTNPELQDMIAGLMGGSTDHRAADPIYLLHGDETLPALFIHGNQDQLVDVENTITFSNRLAHSRTCPVEVHLVDGHHHADLATLFLTNLSVTQTLTRWLETYDTA